MRTLSKRLARLEALAAVAKIAETDELIPCIKALEHDHQPADSH